MLDRLRRWWHGPDVGAFRERQPQLTKSEARRVLATVAECLSRGEYPPTVTGTADCLRAEFRGWFFDYNQAAVHVAAALDLPKEK